jgi:hypothetical protein
MASTPGFSFTAAGDYASGCVLALRGTAGKLAARRDHAASRRENLGLRIEPAQLCGRVADAHVQAVRG